MPLQAAVSRKGVNPKVLSNWLLDRLAPLDVLVIWRSTLFLDYVDFYNVSIVISLLPRYNLDVAQLCVETLVYVKLLPKRLCCVQELEAYDLLVLAHSRILTPA